MKIIQIIIITCLIFLLFPDISSGNTNQGSFRWRNDDGDVYSATWKDSLNTRITLSDNENLRLRIQCTIEGGDTLTTSLGYTEDTFAGPWIPITRSDTGKFIIWPSRYLSDKMKYFDNQLLFTRDTNIVYNSTITFDSSESYYLDVKGKDSLYEFEYSIKPALKIKPGSAYFFSVMENGIPLSQPLDFPNLDYPILMTPPVSWFHLPLEKESAGYIFDDIFFVDANPGTAACNGPYFDGKYWVSRKYILRTIDGGMTWTEQTCPNIGSGFLKAVCFTSADIGTAVGDSGAILRTTNGGRDWIKQNSGTDYDLLSVCFSSTNTGAVLGSYPTFSKIFLRTLDGGTTWSQQIFRNDNLLSAVYFPDADNGFIVGNGTILRTTNGGQKWIDQALGTPIANYLDVFFSDNDNGVAVGFATEDKGIIIRTTDMGKSWLQSSDYRGPGLYSVHFINKDTGWAAGQHGWIIKTTDGGLTWKKLTSGTNQTLRAVQFADEKTGWVIGERGGILKTTNGGIATLVEERSQNQIPEKFYLSQNYPNPFNPSTKINYSIPKAAFISIIVYDILGKEIARLVKEEKPAGSYEASWNAANLPSGVYFYQIKAGDYIQAKKMILIK